MGRVVAVLVVGARPQFIKSAPVVREIISRDGKIDLKIVHSGQHYDPQMSELFFRELKLPEPLMNLQVGSGSHATQTATIMKRLELLLSRTRPDLAIVPGDTNTTLASSLAAVKLGIPVAHIEAGMRSGDMTMPEEVNRKLTDHCSALLFAPTRNAVRNLKKEGLGGITYLTGDTMVDAMYAAAHTVKEKEDRVLRAFGLGPKEYVLVTLHRPSNVDNIRRLGQIYLALRGISKKLRVIFPVHPRTRGRLSKLGVLKGSTKGRITLTSPQGYIETLCLLRNAGCLLTDSGGMQKESFLMHVPCITVRPITEWPETLVRKANQLVPQPERLPKTVLATAFNDTLKRDIRQLRNPFGDGHASERIVSILCDKISKGILHPQRHHV